jgi:hypothetical protein
MGDMRTIDSLFIMGTSELLFPRTMPLNYCDRIYCYREIYNVLKSYIPLFRLFCHLQIKPPTYIPNLLDDKRYAAYLFVI